MKQDEEKKKKLLATLPPEELDAELKVSTEAYFWASLQRSPSMPYTPHPTLHPQPYTPQPTNYTLQPATRKALYRLKSLDGGLLLGLFPAVFIPVRMCLLL